MPHQFKHLLSPGVIGSMTLKNRIFMTPMGSNLADEDGYCGERLRAYYAERAKGGAALITMGSVSIGYPDGSSNWRQEAISDDKYIPGVRAIADVVHEHGAKLCLQLHHAGLVAMNDMLAGRPLWVPSVPPLTKDSGDIMEGFLEDEYKVFTAPMAAMGEIQYKVLTAQDIEQLVQMYASAAERSKRAGADAVEIHAGHGYIISQFLSPVLNLRDDDYGGSIENRSRLLCDVVKGIKAAVGADFPVWARIDSQDFLMSDGISVQDAAKTARLAQEAGLDAIHVSANGHPGRGATYSTGHATDIKNGFVPAAAVIKAGLDIPVICPGRIEPEDAERFIAEGKLDFVTMGRKLLADPHLPKKLAEGRRDDVRPCIYCYTCISQIFFSRPVKCAVNPETGFERERTCAKAATTKRVVVVGGGPAGMESARRLSLRGHKVTLLEQSDRLGGTAQFASIAYKPNQGIVDWLKHQIAKSDVEVRLRTRATPDLLKSLAPDEVVVATGAQRDMPPIPGADRPNVFSGDDMRRLMLGQNLDSIADKTDWYTRLMMKTGAMTGITRNLGFIRAASEWWMPFGANIVIIGGELVGLELAEFLAKRGRKVTVVDEAAKLGAGLQVVRRWRVFDELKELGVTLLPNAHDIAIGDREVTYRNEHGQERTLAADQVIVAKGACGDTRLAENLRAAGFKVTTAGDCNGVGYIDGAMHSAAELAEAI